MPSRSYTQLLWSEHFTGIGFFDSPTVDPSTLWVVRNISLYNGSLGPVDGLGFQVYDQDVRALYAEHAPRVAGKRTYCWEGRQVLYAGDHLSINTLDGEWAIRVTGFIFSAP